MKPSHSACGLHAQERGLEAPGVPWCLFPLGFAEQRACVSKTEKEAVSSLPSLGLNLPKRLGFGCILAVSFTDLWAYNFLTRLCFYIECD